MNPGVKPCASCGSPVAQMAVGRGAVETPDGKRYCSPCAAGLGLTSGPVIEVMPPGTSAQAPSNASGPAVKRQVSTRLIPGKKKTPAPAPAPPTTSGPAAKRQISSRIIAGKAQRPPAKPPAPPAEDAPITVMPLDDKKPAARPASARNAITARLTAGKKPSVASKPGAPAVRPTGREGTGTGAGRISRRISASQVMPWYLRMKRSQLIAVLAGGGLLLLVLIIGGAVAISGGRRQPAPPPAQDVHYDCHASQLLAEADALRAAGKIDEAIKKLEEAATDADRGGRPDLAQKARQLLYGLRFKTVH